MGTSSPKRLVVVAVVAPLLASPGTQADEGAPASDAVAPVASPTAPSAEPPPLEAELTWPPSHPIGGGWSVQPLPGGDDLYPRYVADPRRPRFSMTLWKLFDTDVEDGGEARVGVMLGGRYGFVRLHPDGQPDRGFQLDVEAGFHGQFDLGSQLDSIGWDGYYGLGISWRPVESLALRLAMNHDSSHLGDEYQEGDVDDLAPDELPTVRRRRINYTREELALGVSWTPVERLRLYGEVGWAYHRGNNRLLERGRLQAGVEWETRPVLWGDGAWYVALDAQLWEEDGWRPSFTAQTGVKWRIEALDRDYRLGLQYYQGRSQIGELFQERERYLAFGFWFDL